MTLDSKRRSERKKKIWGAYIAIAVTANAIVNVGAYVFHWWK